MKINLNSIFLLVTGCILQITGVAQTIISSQPIIIPNNYDSWSYHNLCNTSLRPNVSGLTNKDVVYVLQIYRPAIVVVNNSGSKLSSTRITLYQTNNNNPPYTWVGHTNQLVIQKTRGLWGSMPSPLRTQVDADIASILPNQDFICRKVDCGSYRIFCEGGALSDGRPNNGNIRTNVYVYYLGDSMSNAIDLGRLSAPFRIYQQAATSISQTGSVPIPVYYKFTLSQSAEITISNSLMGGTKLTLLDFEGNLLDSSDNYPQLDKEYPQIVSHKLHAGVYYAVSNRYTGAGPTTTCITGKLPSEPDKPGDNAQNPIDFGVITKPYHGTVMYDTREYNNCFNMPYSGDRKDVYLKFNFPQDVEFSVSPDDAKVGGSYVTLLNEKEAGGQYITTNVYPNTSLYKSRLSAGIYYVVLEGAGKDGELGAEIRVLPLTDLTDSLWAPSANMNYVATITPTYETSSSDYVSPRLSNTSINYYDQLGRPIQTKQYAAAPNGNDVVSQQEYNVFGLPAKAYLPVDEGNTGAYSAANNISLRAKALYNDANPYQLAKYEATPLMRVSEQYGPGQVWQDAAKSVKTHYNLNKDSIIRFAIAGFERNPKLVRRAGYKPQSLSVITLTDEDGHSVQRFTDINGRNILTRVENGAEFLDTYSVYDDLGNLCFVLPPMIDASNISAPELDKYAYMYRYDYRNRCIGKKTPGAEWVYSIYDYADNLVFSQDGESRSRGEWYCMLYDRLKRPVITGTYKGRVNEATINGQVIVATFDHTGQYGYSFNELDAESLNVLTVTYYDNYDFKLLLPNYPANLDYAESKEYGIWHNHYIYNAKGLTTGSITTVLDEDTQKYAVTYYDDSKRPIQIRSMTPDGGFSVEKFRYDFAGNVLKSAEIQQPIADADADIIIRENTFDKTGRKLSVRTTLNNGTPAVVTYKYNDIGQLVSATQGEGPNAICTQRKYNIRGWLTGQDNNLFSMKLHYIDPRFATPSYSGNISEWSWHHGTDADENTYAFTYDELSRLTDSRQYVNGVLADKNVERGMSYDRNGNILSLCRYADGRSSSAYSYVYDGNQLASLNPFDANRSPFSSGHGRPVEPVDPDSPFLPAFPEDDIFPNDPILPFISPDTVFSGRTFRYDYNGNMVYDALHSRNIRYNRLNLLKKVFDPSTITVNYRYLADGTKLSVEDNFGNGFAYQGSLVYQKQGSRLILESACVEGGRILSSQSTSGVSYVPQYYLTDHLGSTRAVTDGTAANTVSWDYYPFGKVWSSASSQITDNRYGFNGKEMQPTGNLNLLDYGARMYDPELVIWGVADPMNHLYAHNSPYLYCYGNPLRFIDPTGQFPYRFDWKNGEYVDRAGNAVSWAEISGYIKNSLADVGNEIYDFANVVYTPYLDVMANSTNSAVSITGLMGEFMTGFGKETRSFGEDHVLTKSLKGSNMTKVALAKFWDSYSKGGNPESYRVDWGPVGLFYETGVISDWIKDGGFSTPQFIWTATYFFEVDGANLNIMVKDDKNERSLLLHLPGTDKHTRAENRFMGRTFQHYTFSIPLSSIPQLINK